MMRRPSTSFMLITEALRRWEALTAASGVLSPRPPPYQSITPHVRKTDAARVSLFLAEEDEPEAVVLEPPSGLDSSARDGKTQIPSLAKLG